MTDIEREARAIYDLMPYDFGGSKKPDWVESGNSFQQDRARSYATSAMATYLADLAEAGLVIVPRPATMEMRDAGLKAWRSSRDKHEEQLLIDVHDAMIAAHTEEK